MISYLVRRTLLLPFTLFAIILVNFIILNLAPGEPVNQANLSATGEATRSTDEGGLAGDNPYQLFREHYGLTLPVFFNTWPSLKPGTIRNGIEAIQSGKKRMSVQQYHELKVRWDDRAKFIMPQLIHEASDPQNSIEWRRIAANLFIRGGIRQGHVGATLTPNQRAENREISNSNLFLKDLQILESDPPEILEKKISKLDLWFEEKGGSEFFSEKGWQKAKTLFLKTRFSRYLSRVVQLDFGTLRSDSNKTVIREVSKRIKYSITLAVIPMMLTFLLCQVFGMIMALYQNRIPDYSLNIAFLILFAIPIFVVAPFLIEKIALHKTFPFTNIPIPYSGFHSTSEVYESLTSSKRLADTTLHLFLPLVAIMYGTLAMQARLSRTAFLEVLRQDHVRTARAKGLPWATVLIKHVGRNGAITIVTSLAASLGVVLGGSLIVETIFEINGFGRFFYNAILNRDYNVVLFSAFAGSFLTLVGYLVADIAYMFLDPRISLE